MDLGGLSFNQGRDFGAFDSRLGLFRAIFVVEQLRAHLKPKACGSLESFRKEDPIVSSYHRDRKGVLHHDLRRVEVSLEKVIKIPPCHTLKPDGENVRGLV